MKASNYLCIICLTLTIIWGVLPVIDNTVSASPISSNVNRYNPNRMITSLYIGLANTGIKSSEITKVQLVEKSNPNNIIFTASDDDTSLLFCTNGDQELDIHQMPQYMGFNGNIGFLPPNINVGDLAFVVTWSPPHATSQPQPQPTAQQLDYPVVFHPSTTALECHTTAEKQRALPAGGAWAIHNIYIGVHEDIYQLLSNIASVNIVDENGNVAASVQPNYMTALFRAPYPNLLAILPPMLPQVQNSSTEVMSWPDTVHPNKCHVVINFNGPAIAPIVVTDPIRFNINPFGYFDISAGCVYSDVPQPN